MSEVENQVFVLATSIVKAREGDSKVELSDVIEVMNKHRSALEKLANQEDLRKAMIISRIVQHEAEIKALYKLLEEGE